MSRRRRLAILRSTVGIVSWIILGALVGQAVHTWARDRFPGGFAGRLAAGTAGGFLGGGTFTLATGRGTSRLDAVALALAVIGAVVILLVARSAGYAEPGPR